MAATCQQGTVEGPYTAQNVAFDVICGKGLTGTSYTTPASMMADVIEECMVACAEDTSCIAIVWDNIGDCPLFSSFSASYDDYTDIAVRQQQSTSTSVPSSTTSSAAATSSAAPQCQAGTYTSSTNNVQFNTACGRYYVGTELSSGVVPDLQGCMNMCASDINCVAVSLSYSGNVCHIFSHTDYSTPDASWDLAVLSSRPSSISSAESTSSADSTSATPSSTSSTPPACQSGTYSGTFNQFTITCDGSPNGYDTLSVLGTGYTLQTCLQACDVDSQCDGATFSEQFTNCIVYQGVLPTTYSSGGTDFIYKIPGTSSTSSTSSAELTSLTSSTTSSSASSTTSPASLTCAQLGGTYTGASNTIFQVTCGAILGGSPSSTTQANSFEQCMDQCSTDSTCVGVSFFGSMNRCYLVTVFIVYTYVFISYNVYVCAFFGYNHIEYVFYSYIVYVYVSNINIYVFVSYTFYNYLTYNYNIHPIYNHIHLYNFTDSESKSTFLSTSNIASKSTLEPATSTPAGSSLFSSILTTTATTSNIETSTVVTSASTGNPSRETSTSETTISFSSKSPEASSSSTSQTTTETESTVLSTQQQISPVTGVPSSESPTSPSLTTSTTS
ncbi:MUC1-Extracellular alpha-14-glucan glucosidase [Fusarium acutatum]|uniref:MUC1-Extracellular alpha-14-glucan glucosidase n=1 Tax=Fusarium acutatum TaxID=78861 RepID=A0A8H4J958_9HYPO|nr:MUC1-Extracellular alpha-14-glucan glucosidase [Fusarium acutatum]